MVEETNFMVHLALLTRQGGEIACDPRFNQFPIHSFEVWTVVFARYTEIESKSTVELDVDEARTDDTASKVVDHCGCSMLIEKFLLVVKNPARCPADPKVLPDKLVVDKQSTIGKSDDTLIVRHAERRNKREHSSLADPTPASIGVQIANTTRQPIPTQAGKYLEHLVGSSSPRPHIYVML